MTIYGSDGTAKAEASKIEYEGTWLGTRKISVDVVSPVPIEFANGDYLDFRGERFTLRYKPSVSKTASSGSKGNAFAYETMIFYSYADELTRCEFRDVVLEDNNIHYTSLPKFSFYCQTAQDFADRLKANLDILYPDMWTVNVVDGTEITSKALSYNGISCWEALTSIKQELKLNFFINGRTITIGDVVEEIPFQFRYGKGNGLKQIDAEAKDEQAIITRLYVYGSTRNIPNRYYNNLWRNNSTGELKYDTTDLSASGYTRAISESMYMPNLMLPMFTDPSLIGTTDADGTVRYGGELFHNAYIESVRGVAEYGVNEGHVFLDGSGGDEDVYPSLEGMTAEELIAAGIRVSATGELDVIVSADDVEDNGVIPEGETAVGQFVVYIKDIGFNINDYLTSEEAAISFKSGACAGREFKITSVEVSGNGYKLTCNRVLDNTIDLAFPNSSYKVATGDKFVLLYITMPQVYILAAQQRLLAKGKAWLLENDNTTYNTTPHIDDIMLARNPEIAELLKEGKKFMFKDDDLGMEESIFISSLKITVENGGIAKYEVTISDDVDASFTNRITESVKSELIKDTAISNNTKDISRGVGDARYLRKDVADRATKRITFEQGVGIGKSGESASVDADGNIQGKSLALKIANDGIPCGMDDMGKLTSIESSTNESHTKTASISESMGSEGYVPGFTGKGWNMRMSGGLSYLDIDNLTLRGSMTVYELLIKQIRATNGGIVVSASNGRVKRVDGTDSIAHLPGDTVKVWYEQGNPFKAGDFVRCMKWDTAHNRMHQYWAKVKAIGTDPTYGDYTEFDYAYFDTYKGGSGPAAIERLDIPRVGDEAVLFGSTVSGRQGVIYIAAAEDEPPCIEVLEGVTTNSIEGVQRTRLGSLKQMSDTDFDGLIGGSGLYSDNAYLKGRFFLSSKGEEVDAFVSRVSNEQATQTNLIAGAGDLSTCKAYGTRTVLAVSYDTTEAAMCVEKQTSSTTASYNYAMMFADTKTAFAELANVAKATDLTFTIYIKGDGSIVTPPTLRFSSRTVSTEGSLTTEWKRFEYHFASTWNLGAVYAFILSFADSEVGGKCWLKMPQMERGNQATAWSDFVKSSSLIKQTADSIVAKVNETGIDIENKTITLTADKTYIKGTDGTAMAAFTDGKLQRAFLDLGNLELTSEAVPTIDNFEWTAGYNTNGTLTDVTDNNNNSALVAADILEDFTVEIGTKYVASGLTDGDLVAVNAGITFTPSNTTTVKNAVITATVNGEAADYDDANEQVLFTYKGGTSTYDIQVSITFTLQGKRYTYAGDTIIAIPQTEYNAFIRGWNGTANNIKVYHNPSVAAYNNRTIIGSNGMVSYWGGKYLFHQSVPTGEGNTSESGVTIIAGRNGWKITDKGIMISNNGGLDWHTA